MMNNRQNSHDLKADLDKFKHEVLGSLGLIKTMTDLLIQEHIENEKTKDFLKLIKSLAERNMQIVTDFDNR
jgi:hypothetical protein